MKLRLMLLPCLFFILHVSSIWSQNPLIDTTCQKTPHYKLCVQTLRSDPRSLKASSVKGLAVIALDIVKAKANETLNHIGDAFKNNTDPVLYRKYGTCVLSYDRAVNMNLKVVVETLKSGAYAAASDGLKTVMETDFIPCEEMVGESEWAYSSETGFIMSLTEVVAAMVQTLG